MANWPLRSRQQDACPVGWTTGFLIAATARVDGARLYTLNPDDLLGVGDLLEVVEP
jgi:predicted nucleic acid-binding protein